MLQMRQAPTRSRRDRAEASGGSLLHLLSESCNKHRAFHVKKKNKNPTEKPCKECQNALDALSRVVPKVEETYSAHRPVAVAATDVGHLCDFYMDVLQGGFCPHAPQLFQKEGSGENQLLKRVHGLFEHLTMRSLWQNAVDAASNVPSSPRAVGTVVSRTAAHLLLAWGYQHSSLENGRRPFQLIQDWVQTAMDCSILVESNLLAPAADEDEGQRPLVSLALFDSPDDDDNDEYVISIPNQEALLSLQAAVLETLHEWLFLVQQERLSGTSHDDICSGGISSPDAWSTPLDAASCATLWRVVRQALLQIQSKASSSRAVRILTGRVHRAGLALLRTSLADWRRGCYPSWTVFHETVLLVGRAIVQHMQGDDHRDDECAWAEILHGLVLDPPHVQGSFRGEVAPVVYKLLWPSLLEAASHMRRSSEGDDRPVERAILRTLFVARKEMEGASLPHNVLLCLVSFLDDLVLSEGALWIVSLELDSDELERVCQLYLAETPTLNSSMDVEEGDRADSSGSKRKASFGEIDDQGPVKRLRGDGTLSSTDSRDTWSFHDAIGRFLQKAHTAAQCQIQGSLKQDILIDRMCVANGLSLAHLLVQRHDLLSDSHSLPNLEKFCAVSLCAMKDVSESVSSESVVALEGVHQSLATIVVRCGAIVCRRQSDVFAEDEPGSFAKIADRMYSLLQGTSDEFPKLCRELQEAAFFLAVHERQSPTYERVVVAILEGHLASVNVARAEKAPVVDWVGPVFVSMNPCADTQRRRLSLLALRTGQKEVVTTAVLLPQLTYDVVKNVRKDHADPVVRLLSWQSFAWMVLATNPRELRRIVSNGRWKVSTAPQSISTIQDLIDVSIADPDVRLRDYASRELGSVFVDNSWTSVAAVLANDDEFGDDSDEKESLLHAEKFASTLFHHVDRLLHEYCCVPQSQLSFSITSSSNRKEAVNEAKQVAASYKALEFQRSAVRSLLSLCQHIDARTTVGQLVFENAFIRIVRLWTGVGPSQRLETQGVCFGELSRLSRLTNLSEIIQGHLFGTLIPKLFRDVVMPGTAFADTAGSQGIDTVTPEHRERQYCFLSSFIRSFMVQPAPMGLSKAEVRLDPSTADVERFLESFLPVVFAEFVIDKDYDVLRMVTGYKLYLLGQKRIENKRSKRSGSAVVETTVAIDSVAGSVSSTLMTHSMTKRWTSGLEDQTRKLCLAPTVIERIIPLIFRRAGRAELLFFIETVLQNTLTLNKIINSREQLILRGLVWEMGRDPSIAGPALHAIRAAAFARRQDSEGLALSYSESRSEGLDRDSAVTEWITAQFMYLLVNVVQSKWQFRNLSERVQAMRCLAFMMGSLKSEDSAQYMPQILATVNSAVAQRAGEDDIEGEKLAGELRLLAVRVLSKFVRLVASHQWETVAQNLTAIVVSVIPLVADDDGSDNVLSLHTQEYRQEAVSLLEWLTSGVLGRNLAGFFAEIPFLPPSPALDSVRATLKTLGVDFGNLQILPTQSTQQGSIASDAASSTVDSRGLSSNARRQVALRRRLDMVCALLGNENVSIRRVALQHLTSLLRSNRELFHVLVDNEGTTTMRRYLTIAKSETTPGFSRGAVTELIEVLLARCFLETDPEVRILVATCFGEVGAISEHRLDETKTGATSFLDADSGTYAWRLGQPPWGSDARRYEVQLVTHQLVVALKAAPTSSDQHKVAFSIQQLLALLDRSSRESGGVKVAPHDGGKPEMNDWLKSKLAEANVLDVVEPFWFTEFHEAEVVPVKQPPFFTNSTTYYSWMSNWCRFMVQRAHDSKKSDWRELFFACRTSIRTQAGLGVIDFLLPLLVLDRVCFGDGHDFQTVLKEMTDALTFSKDGVTVEVQMSRTERQKAVSTLFMMIDTLLIWNENETEKRSQRDSRYESKNADQPQSTQWNVDESVMRITDLVQEIPLTLLAEAAANVGMHARALRLLEMSARSGVVRKVFDTKPNGLPRRNRSASAGELQGSALGLMKETLAALNDFETMASLAQDDFQSSPAVRTQDSIRLKEAMGDWEGALQDYEFAQQLHARGALDLDLQGGALHCLLALGQFDSVVNQVSGIVHRLASDPAHESKDAGEKTIPLAIEAAWRLGRWDTLSELVTTASTSDSDSDGSYQIALGEVMLSIHSKNAVSLSEALRRARTCAMDGLSSVARESYSRAYDHVVRLQCLREVEDVADMLCDQPSVSLGDLVNGNAWGWNRRLDFVSTAGSSTVINARLALTRLGADPSFEGSLFLGMGKRARKGRQFGFATSCFAQAETAFKAVEMQTSTFGMQSELLLQCAKLKYECGETTLALRMLGEVDIELLGEQNENTLREESTRHVQRMLGSTKHAVKEQDAVDVFAKSALQSTRWMIEGGLKGGAEINAGFRVIHRVAPKWEKGHFQYAKYIDSLLQSRIAALQRRLSGGVSGDTEGGHRDHTIAEDRTCQKFIIQAIQHYLEALRLDSKHVYHALPRLLSLWFDFTSIRNYGDLDAGNQTTLKERQSESNHFMAKHFKSVPAHAFYTAIPQLVSRVTHDDEDTAAVVRSILKRVLAKYPLQAMWPLAWLRQSRSPQRSKIGDDIFNEASRKLKNAPNEKFYRLLVASQSLLAFLRDLALHNPKERLRSFSVKMWKGEVALSEFIPPVQAALSASLSLGDSGLAREIFPRHVPRMRIFAPKVEIFQSKARPKRLKALMVSAESRFSVSESGKDSDKDIGEIHFLVKQEPKGDLRKDARVQDLNLVINRLLAASKDADGVNGSRRKLRLRTFAVTCLTEDTGLLEWIPDTEGLRNVIGKAYNPQAPTFSTKRRGKNLINFADPVMRKNYDKCQELYFKQGNLKRATVQFEDLFIKPSPPLLYWWFVQHFRDPYSWYEARTRFTLGAAVWSGVGHVIGLGDRHTENILVDTRRGELVHVDFDCIFDKGLELKFPETVPFRLTQNMMDAFGPTGADGVYTVSLKTVMRTLRDNRDTLLSVLEPFVKDPIIDWKRMRHRQEDSSASKLDDQVKHHKGTRDAKRSMSVIDERLRGIYNLRNPNLKKIKRTDVLAETAEDDDTTLLPLSVEGQVHKMIAEATSHENLVQLYVGWMSWV